MMGEPFKFFFLKKTNIKKLIQKKLNYKKNL